MREVNYPKIKHEFVQIEKWIIHDLKDWAELNPTSQAVYLQMRAAFKARDSRGKPYNTSYQEIKFGYKDMLAKISKGAFYNARNELIKLKFIKIVSKGSSNKKQFGEKREHIKNEKMIKKTTVYDLLREGRNAQ